MTSHKSFRELPLRGVPPPITSAWVSRGGGSRAIVAETMLLLAENLTKRYGSFTALEGLNFQMDRGEVVGLLGPNGSGKTTALRLMLGFLRPSAGSSRIDGHDSWTDSVAARRQVAYLPAELRLYENMTGRQLIRFLSDLRNQPVLSLIHI